MEKQFYTQCKRPEKVYEYNSGEKMVERFGFRSVRDQFRDIIQAGKRNAIYQGYDSDVQPDIDDLQWDPTRRANYDLADLSIDLAGVRQRLEESKQQRLLEEEEKRKNAGIEDHDLGKTSQIGNEVIPQAGEDQAQGA